MNKKTQHTSEETLEERLDKLNYVLKNTIKDTDSVCTYKKNTSVSYLNSFTTSFCNLESLDQDFYIENREFSCIEENIESVFVALDRSQMQVEDFWAEKLRSDEKNNEKKEFTQKTRQKSPYNSPSKAKIILATQIEELQKLIKSLKNKKISLKKIENDLKSREQNLQQKENEFEISKQKFEKLAKDPNFNNTECKNLNILRIKDLNTSESLPEHDPNLQALKMKLEKFEAKLRTIKNPDKKKKLSNAIYQITNKISLICAEKVIQDCSKPSRFLKPGNDYLYERPIMSSQFDHSGLTRVSTPQSLLSLSPQYKYSKSKA